MLKKALVVVGLSVSSCTACLPYGVPPCPDGTSDCYDLCNQPLVDGGSPRNDPTTGCSAPVDAGVDGGVDGGMP